MQPVVGRNYIGGEWLTPRGDFPSRNPANLAEAVGHFPSGTVAEANQAVSAARSAFPGLSACCLPRDCRRRSDRMVATMDSKTC